MWYGVDRLVVQDVARVLLKVLRVQDVLKLIDALQGVVHVGGQVAVQEAKHVPIKGETHRHAPFVALRRGMKRICVN